MTKNEFLNKLRSSLSGLPQEEIEKTLDYYCELIDDAVEEGRNESEVIAGFDSIDNIADKIINETPIRKFVQADVKNYHISAAVIVLLIVGSPVWFPIFVALGTIAFTLYIMLWTIAAVFFAVCASLALSGVSMLITAPFLLPVRPLKAMAAFGMALVGMGSAVFLFYLSLWFSKLIIRFTLFLIRSIKNIFIKRRNNA